MSNQRKIIIAIDGPAASGKSTTARKVAEKLDYIYIDTGAMYRAVTLQALRKGIPVNNMEAVSAVAKDIKLYFSRNSDRTVVYMDEEDISEAIRTPEIDRNISPVAANAQVRKILVKKQQEMGKEGGVVLDGRDIGTVVFPGAELKIYMLASVEERALRRKTEQEAKGLKVDLEQIKQDIHYRDKQDRERAHGPLKKADDAIEIDTTNLTINQQVEKIYRLATQKIKSLN